MTTTEPDTAASWNTYGSTFITTERERGEAAHRALVARIRRLWQPMNIAGMGRHVKGEPDD